ncbi:MAG TPA: amidohydrolase family protein, partial [Acidimicrobiales bacterium]|nr:amidohydrolase family protein [Acidimicrobiales bacterium]
KQNFAGRPPSEVFREHFLTCFINDPAGIANRHQIGIDSMAWEGDYPHPDGLWPYAPEDLMSQFERFGVTDEEARKITHENGLRWYSFDPFGHIPKAEATVGALRRRAAGHDVAIVPGAVRKRTPDEALARHRAHAEEALAAAPA